MLRKQLYNIVFQKQVFSGGSNPNETNQQPSNENNEDRFIPPVNPNIIKKNLDIAFPIIRVIHALGPC